MSAVSCSWLTRSSNSVTTAGPAGTGRPQLGFPRLREGATGIAIGPDHTPPEVALPTGFSHGRQGFAAAGTR